MKHAKSDCFLQITSQVTKDAHGWFIHHVKGRQNTTLPAIWHKHAHCLKRLNLALDILSMGIMYIIRV